MLHRQRYFRGFQREWLIIFAGGISRSYLIAQTIGVKMTKQIFADSISKVIPVLGGIVSGGLTYATFRTCAGRLKRKFDELKICDPEFYIKE